MRDAAAAAAMSDPENNRWFRRRWSEAATVVVQQEVSADPDDNDLGLLGHKLLADWRRERAERESAR